MTITTPARALDWTAPRRRALAVFTMNRTAQIGTRSSAEHARIHWPAAAWLLRERLIRRRPLSDWVELTAAGAAAMKDGAHV